MRWFCVLAISFGVSLATTMSVALADDTCLREASLCGLTAEEMLNYSEPDVQLVTFENSILYDRHYQQVNQAVEIFDAPNGQVTDTLPEGFNFFTTLASQDGWTQINASEWVKSDALGSSNSTVSLFSGVLLPDEPLPYPMAWTLVNLYPSEAPGEKPSENNPLLWRYTRVNIYTSVEVGGYLWYQIGKDQWVHQHHVAQLLPVERPENIDTNHWISIDLYEQVVIAYEGETPVFATLISTGMSDWPTYEGVFHIYFRHPRKTMQGGVAGNDFYYLEEVPWTMFFDEGRALHGAYWHDGFGYRRSHGCVNLSITDAHWLYQWVADEMGTKGSADIEEGPAVYVFGSGSYH